MDWPLPLWQVLGEELDRLRPATAADVAPTESPASAEASLYNYRPQEVIDAELLAEQLKLRRPELRPLLGKDSEPSRPAAFATHFVSADPSPPPPGVLPDVHFLNRLLKVPELYTAFPSLAESGWICDWIKEQKSDQLPLDQIIKLNRWLLDIAFAGAVQPIAETMLSGVVDKLHESKLSALCFSGGGIRSATFCLGVVQGLARRGLLDRFDYLSTVSGGGYLAGWLAAWTYWSKGGLPDVAAQLADAKSSKLEPEPDPIFYLRNFSNYLTPRTGFLSADTWTLIGIFLRNLLLHWSVILPPLIAILLVPDLLFSLMRHDWTFTGYRLLGWTIDARATAFLLAVIAMAVAVFYEGTARPSHLDVVRESSLGRPWLARRGQGSFIKYFLAPLMLSSFIFSTYILHTPDIGIGTYILYGVASGVLGWLALVILLRRGFLYNLTAVAISGVAGGALLYFVVSSWTLEFHKYPTLYFCLMPPITMIIFLIAATIFIGLVTLFTTDEDREYWARIGAWALIAVLGWSVFGGISLFGPLLLLKWTMVWSLAGTATSGLTTFLGWSSKTTASAGSNDGGPPPSLMQRVLPLIGVVALALILCALALAGLWLVQVLSAGVIALHPKLEGSILAPIFSGWNAIAIPQLYSGVLHGAFSGAVVLATLIMMVIFLTVTSIFIDVNKYSLHAMYRNRLIRAYLGASRRKGERKPNPFTGFDPDDNLEMWKLWQRWPAKLMPVVNISLNLVAPIADKLAWQERKAETYTVTPLHVGNFRSGYRRSEDYASNNIPLFRKPRPNDPKLPLTLGTATAISGAAVSPNMGYNSSPIVTMLLSLFNVRLGWWLGNPGPAGNKTYMRGQPGFGVKYFADEALGRTSAEQKYVHLSDGGHFENLGLYEMVLRRCHTIVVIDADQDVRSTFDNLGNAIRKVRIDLGISIEFPTFPNFAKRNAGGKTAYCAVGTINYDPEDPDAPNGHLIYVKPTIVGDEPADVLNYERRCGEFPHETTADQWFSESQFESYRALGMYEIEKIIGDALETDPESEYAAASLILGSLPRPTPAATQPLTPG